MSATSHAADSLPFELLHNVDIELAALPAIRATRAMRPARVTIALERVSLRQAVWSLPVIDASMQLFRGASFDVEGDSIGAALIREHIRARQSVPSPFRHGHARMLVAARARERAPLTIELQRGHRPNQHACGDAIDGGRLGGLPALDGAPLLALRRVSRARARARARREFGVRGGPLVFFIARGAEPTPRSYGARMFAQVARILRTQLGAQCVSLGVPIEGTRHLSPAEDPVLFAALLPLAAVAIGDDTGWTHVAAAAGAHVVSLHGRNASWRTAPVSDRVVAAYHSQCSCTGAEITLQDGRGCLRCLPQENIVRIAIEATARAWPWDRIRRCLP